MQRGDVALDGEARHADQLSEAISHATATAFRCRGRLPVHPCHPAAEGGRTRAPASGNPSAEAPEPLQKRAALLNQAIYLSVLSALATAAALLIVAFVCALAGINHRTGVAVMFVVALVLLMAALIELTREVRITLKSMNLD